MMKKFIVALLAALTVGAGAIGLTACDEFFEEFNDVKVTVTEWNNAFEFDYAYYQIDVSFIPENTEQKMQKVKLEKDGDITRLQLAEDGEDEEYAYSVYAAKIGNDYEKYDRDEKGAWRSVKQTKEEHKEFHASTIVKNLLGEISWSSFTYSETEYAYIYTQALPSGENVATYTVEFLDNRIVEMNMEINIAPITFTFMGMEVELPVGNLICKFTYEEKDLVLPPVDSSNDTDSKVTAEEWSAALSIFDNENIQINIMQNDVYLGLIVKDGDIICFVSAEGEEAYMQINEEGDVLKAYYIDETGAWRVEEYDDERGVGFDFSFDLNGADYSLFTYDETEGVYSFTWNGPFSEISTDEESTVTTTVSLRFSNKKLVEMIITETNKETATVAYEIVLVYTYYNQNVGLPTVPSSPPAEDNGDNDGDNDGDNILTEEEWIEALDLTTWGNFQLKAKTSDGFPVVIKRDENIFYICLISDVDGAQEEYFAVNDGTYWRICQDYETGSWGMEECSESDFESCLPLNFNKSFSYAEFTYDGQLDVYSCDDIILKFSNKRLIDVWDMTDGTLLSVDYDAVELTLPTGIICYELLEDNTYEVVGVSDLTCTEIVIPSTYNGLPVTSISYEAFEDCYSLTSVTIGDSVTSIGSMAFYCCRSLTSVTIGNSVTSIGDWAFANCTSLTSIDIPDSVTSIGVYAFIECFRLVEVYNKSSLNIVAGSSDYGFIGCYAKNVYTEEGGSKLTTDENGFIIYDGNCLVHYIGEETEITIPDCITAINRYALYCLYDLTKVDIPDSVTSIGVDAFLYCRSLTSISVDENNANYSSLDGNLYDKNQITLIQYAIGKTDTSFIIPDSVTSIGEDAFANCTSLTSIDIPDSVTSIVWYAFFYCSSLTSITFEGTVAQWNAISKGSSWNSSVPATEVVCSDGTVTL